MMKKSIRKEVIENIVVTLIAFIIFALIIYVGTAWSFR